MDAPGQPMQVNQPKKRAVQKRTGQPPKATDAPSSNPIPPSHRDVPTQDNDDDDFQPQVARTRIKVAGCKRAGDASTSKLTSSRRKLMPTINEVNEDDWKKTGKTCCRCSPIDVIEAIKILSVD